jgi:hypothetical protein
MGIWVKWKRKFGISQQVFLQLDGMRMWSYLEGEKPGESFFDCLTNL